MIALSMLIGNLSYACPDLSGSYSCNGDSIDLVILTSGKQYNISGETFNADGKEQKMMVDTIGSETRQEAVVIATCNEKSLNLLFKGQASTTDVSFVPTSTGINIDTKINSPALNITGTDICTKK